MNTKRKWALVFTASALAGVAWFAQANAGGQTKSGERNQLNAIFEKLKNLTGEWVAAEGKSVGPKAKIDKGQVVLRYALTGGGSAVAETVFPGSAIEMLSVYHRDGDQLVMTHYCCAGNQPRFRARPGKNSNEVIFEFVGGANINPAKDGHIHGGLIRFIDADRLHTEWDFCVNGKVADKHAFDLIRKK